VAAAGCPRGTVHTARAVRTVQSILPTLFVLARGVFIGRIGWGFGLPGWKREAAAEAGRRLRMNA